MFLKQWTLKKYIGYSTQYKERKMHVLISDTINYDKKKTSIKVLEKEEFLKGLQNEDSKLWAPLNLDGAGLIGLKQCWPQKKKK